VANCRWLGNQSQLDKWQAQFICNLCAKLPTGQHKNWEKCQAPFPHAQAALAQRPKDKELLKKWALLLYNAAWYAWQQGRGDEAEHMSTVSMEVRQEVLGRRHVDTLSSMGMVRLARELGGKYEEAEAMNRQTLARREKVLGREHPDTLMSLYCLARLLAKLRRYHESLALYERAYVGYHTVLRVDHPTIRACHQHYSEAKVQAKEFVGHGSIP
jgi:tetratricopeptide (TPR) repeat protein